MWTRTLSTTISRSPGSIGRCYTPASRSAGAATPRAPLPSVRLVVRVRVPVRRHRELGLEEALRRDPDDRLGPLSRPRLVEEAAHVLHRGTLGPGHPLADVVPARLVEDDEAVPDRVVQVQSTAGLGARA